MKIWNYYNDRLTAANLQSRFGFPVLHDYATNNAHMFYLICQSLEDRNNLIAYCNRQQINAVFHYLSLHKSPYFTDKHDGRVLTNADHFADCLVRLPFHYGLTEKDQEYIVDRLINYSNGKTV